MSANNYYSEMLENEIYPAREPRKWAAKLDGGILSGGRYLLQAILRGLPVLMIFIIFVGGWEIIERVAGIPSYILPKPSDIFEAAAANWDNLLSSIRTTFTESLLGFGISIILGISIATALALSRTIERGVYPYAIVLQTIPVVATAPIIVIWFGAGMNAIVTIAFIISFFPILSNTLIGLNSTDQNMKNLFYLYNATRMQTIWKLRIPAAMPYILAGLKISCSSAVVGAIVGEYIAGIGGGKGGLGYAITVAATRLQTPYLFACGLSASLLGILSFLLVNAISKRLLSSWHESEMK